jgi:hypothetical protein
VEREGEQDEWVGRSGKRFLKKVVAAGWKGAKLVGL